MNFFLFRLVYIFTLYLNSPIRFYGPKFLNIPEFHVLMLFYPSFRSRFRQVILSEFFLVAQFFRGKVLRRVGNIFSSFFSPFQARVVWYVNYNSKNFTALLPFRGDWGAIENEFLLGLGQHWMTTGIWSGTLQNRKNFVNRRKTTIFVYVLQK